MNASTIIFYASIIGVMFGVRSYRPLGDKHQNRKTLKESLPWFGLLGILSAFRHIVFSGGLGKKYGGIWGQQGKLFEYEAGVANLSFGILCFRAMEGSVKEQQAAILGYAIYLFGSMIVHIYTLSIDKTSFGQRMGTIIGFLITTVIMFQISLFS